MALIFIVAVFLLLLALRWDASSGWPQALHMYLGSGRCVDGQRMAAQELLIYEADVSFRGHKWLEDFRKEWQLSTDFHYNVFKNQRFKPAFIFWCWQVSNKVSRSRKYKKCTKFPVEECLGCNQNERTQLQGRHVWMTEQHEKKH